MLILVAHGSRDPRWRASIEVLAERVATKLPSTVVKVAFMQFDGPTLTEVVDEAVRDGHPIVRLLPLFMSRAGHVEKDIVPLVEDLTRGHGGARITLMTPVGEDILFPDLIADIAIASIQSD
jgi:sirohydrochlorin cobaltochelatase